VKPKKRRVNRAFNSFIEPRATDIERVERLRYLISKEKWQNKGQPQ